MIYTLTKDGKTYRTADRGEVVNMAARGWTVEAEEKARPAAQNKARKGAQNKSKEAAK